MAEPGGRGFWNSLPGVLTALAAVITAMTGAWLAITRNQKNPPAAASAADVTRPKPDGSDRPRPLATVDVPHEAAAGTNLLAADNGGALVFSGSANWGKMIDGNEDDGAQIGEQRGDFGIFAFRDRRPARIGAFTTMVPQADPYNPTAIELSYAVASEDGPFVPIGVFTIRDGRVAPDGRQMFRFTPVVARFLKVKLRETRTGSPYVMSYEFGVLGTPAK